MLGSKTSGTEGDTAMGLSITTVIVNLCFIILLLAWGYLDLGRGHRA
jgi:hypothetical protein